MKNCVSWTRIILRNSGKGELNEQVFPIDTITWFNSKNIIVICFSIQAAGTLLQIFLYCPTASNERTVNIRHPLHRFMKFLRCLFVVKYWEVPTFFDEFVYASSYLHIFSLRLTTIYRTSYDVTIVIVLVEVYGISCTLRYIFIAMLGTRRKFTRSQLWSNSCLAHFSFSLYYTELLCWNSLRCHQASELHRVQSW
jgi:hypothetical protein